MSPDLQELQSGAGSIPWFSSAPLRLLPNVTHIWFTPQDFPETRFSTSFHSQAINSAPKANTQQILLKFPIETKESIILHITSQILPNFYIKLLSPQVQLFGKSSPTLPLLNILIILGSSVLFSYPTWQNRSLMRNQPSVDVGG